MAQEDLVAMLRDAGLDLSDFLGRPGTPPAAGGTLARLADLWSVAWEGRADYSPGAAALRALRMSRVLAWGEAHQRLAANPVLQAHVATVAPGDALFWLAHQFYLARGLSSRDRVDLALSHYGFEAERFGACYLRQVYDEGGLTLWRAEVAGVVYDVRLMPGNDVLYEGGLSVVLHVDGGRVCVLSFSWVPERIALGQGGEAVLPLIARKQLAGDRSYQAAFNKAFDQTMPATLCLAALCGVTAAVGQDRMVGIATDRHPAMTPDHKERFEAAYDEFWAGLGGQRTSPLGYVMDVPLRLTPIESLDRSRRRRAMARRGHMDALCQSARATIEGHLKAG